ncbi:PIN domain-containing protein [uncultured Sphaerochaeta sp.]|uniref:PIN domain-containing protein n=1 Tax=uncultured Sphaerochaeta sp. TaxID=886478 RepID=UPI002A0A4A70|nr:PIN domain-containing protein [uncultured Sphaerochaeta sp.]
MTLIHFRRFDTLDWQSILDTSEEVSLIITPIVLRELNTKKDSDQNKGIRKRSGDILKVLEKYQDNGEIKEGINLNFISIEPQVDWKQIGLDPDVGDDRLIASMINEEDVSKLILVTSDFGLKLKARNWEIKTVKLDDSLKENIRIDADAKKIKELERKLSHYENASPKLELYVKESPDSKFHEFKYIKVSGIDSSAIDAEIEKLKSELEYKVPIVNGIVFGANILGGFNEISESEIERYKSEVNEYLEKKRAYPKNKNQYENHQSRLFTLNLILSNTGGKVASNIDIFIHFPDGFEILEKKVASRYHEPSPPARPTPPRTAFQMLEMNHSSFDIKTISSMIPRPHNFTPLELGVDYFLESINKTQSYEVHFQVKKLKQNMKMALDPICILFRSYDEIKPFSFDYVINVENHPDEFVGKYHIKFELVDNVI